MTELTLLGADGATRRIRAREPIVPDAGVTPRGRVAFAAAHVVPLAWADNAPGDPARLDWDATLGFRRRIWALGLGVADAMDTAQRNMGLDWAATAELMRRSAAAARESGGEVVVGVSTDHLEEAAPSLDQIVDAYLLQLDTAEDAGAGVVLMASRHLARTAQSPADYERVYARVIDRAGSPVTLHWLGPAFDPQLAGYFGADLTTASDTVLRIIAARADRIRGIKMSLLDADAEIALRRRLPEGVRMFTGDDYNFVRLIEGDEQGHSDALLGAFAAVAPVAAAALARLDAGDTAGYRAMLGPAEELARTIFEAPTPFYKVGVAFLSWLNGHQPAFQLVGGLHSARGLPHLSRLVELAAAAGALEAPDTAAERWNGLLHLNGVTA